jgi:hypothetical protein
MSIHISHQARRDCYATMWSYGEICVGCGCCGTGEKAGKARLGYWKDLLKESRNFRGWFKDNPELYALQKKNKKSDIKLERLMVWYYGGKP